MKRFISIAFLLLLSNLSFFGQGTANRGLKISGSVVKIDSRCINGKPVPQITVYIQFHNKGDVPLLLIPPQIPFFETKVRFQTEDYEDAKNSRVLGDALTYNPYLDNPFGTPTIEAYDPKPQFVNGLKTSKKPVKQIEPGGYYEFQDVLWVPNGFKVPTNSVNSKGECEAPKEPPIPEYSFLTVEYYLSTSKYDGGTDLLKVLQERWKSFGYFPLNDKGDVSYISEKIRLNIASK